MRPLVCTSGMKEGTLNELEVLKRLPEFIDSRTSIFNSGFGDGTGRGVALISEKIEIHHIRCVGLINSPNHLLVCDSPDALAAMKSTSGGMVVVSIVVKTKTSVATIDAANRTRDLYDSLINITCIGENAYSNKLFCEVVPNVWYRAQCLHHAATADTNTVLYVVAKAGRTTYSGIIFVAQLHFSDQIIHSYLYALDTLHVGAFEWIGRSARNIPDEYDTLVRDTFASDLQSFSSYYNISLSLKKHIQTTGLPLVPSEMVRPTVLVFWNAVKGGVDEYSRSMTNLTHHNVTQDPLTTVFLRLLMSQVHNAAISYGLYIASLRGIVSSREEDNVTQNYGYKAL